MKNINYSEYWRVNKSYIEHIEMANALKALRKVVGQLGVDAEVLWAGMAPSHGDKIELSAPLVLGEYPIPAGNHTAAQCNTLSRSLS